MYSAILVGGGTKVKYFDVVKAYLNQLFKIEYERLRHDTIDQLVKLFKEVIK